MGLCEALCIRLPVHVGMDNAMVCASYVRVYAGYVYMLQYPHVCSWNYDKAQMDLQGASIAEDYTGPIEAHGLIGYLLPHFSSRSLASWIVELDVQISGMGGFGD